MKNKQRNQTGPSARKILLGRSWQRKETLSRRNISKFLILILPIGFNAFLEFAAHLRLHIAAFIWPERLYSLEHVLFSKGK